MSKSHLINKEFGSISINNDQLSALIGHLYINNNPVGGGINYNSNGTLYNLTPTYGSLQLTNQLTCFSDTIGNITNTGLLITNNNFNSFDIVNTTAVGNTSGTLISNLSGNSGLYIGDDGVTLFNNESNGTNSNLLIDANTIYFCNGFSSIGYNTFISWGNYLSTPNFYANDTCTLSNACFTGNIFYSGAISNYTQTGGNTSTITAYNNDQMATLTTTSLTLSTFGSLMFTVNNNSSNSNPITLSITGYTGTTGNPYAYIQSVNTTSFNIVINNNSNVHPLNGSLTLLYNILFQT